MPHATPAGPRLVVLALAVTAVITAALLGLPPTASAAPPPLGPPITDLATDTINSDYRPDLISLRHHRRVHLDSGTYTYGQAYDGSLTHDQPALHIPAGTYTLHDTIRDGLGAKIHTSYLDPAPDPKDPASGVIITSHPLPTRPKTFEWGSVLIRTR